MFAFCGTAVFFRGKFRARFSNYFTTFYEKNWLLLFLIHYSIQIINNFLCFTFTDPKPCYVIQRVEIVVHWISDNLLLPVARSDHRNPFVHVFLCIHLLFLWAFHSLFSPGNEGQKHRRHCSIIWKRKRKILKKYLFHKCIRF